MMFFGYFLMYGAAFALAVAVGTAAAAAIKLPIGAVCGMADRETFGKMLLAHSATYPMALFLGLVGLMACVLASCQETYEAFAIGYFLGCAWAVRTEYLYWDRYVDADSPLASILFMDVPAYALTLMLAKYVMEGIF